MTRGYDCNVVMLPNWVAKIKVDLLLVRVSLIVGIEPGVDVTVSTAKCTEVIRAIMANLVSLPGELTD